MKGLPPKDESDSGYLCRPSSVRPLMASGSSTGALYMAYSSTRRTHGVLSHKLHHTYAVWELAPPNSSHASPAPMLAGFDWFMPDHNLV